MGRVAIAVGALFLLGAAFWLFAAVLIIATDDNPNAFAGCLLLAGFCGGPGAALFTWGRRKTKHADRSKLVVGFMHSRDAFTAREVAELTGMTHKEAESLIVIKAHEVGVNLLHHTKTDRYLRADRIQQTYHVVTHCPSCGASVGNEVVFEGEQQTCRYCDAPLWTGPGPHGAGPQPHPQPHAAWGPAPRHAAGGHHGY